MAQLERIGKYQVTEVVGRGAMGVVYKAFDPNIRRTVAIKTIRLDGTEDDTTQALLARFRNEAQAAGRLSHPGIVSVYEYGEDEGIAYIAMEFIQGNSLREYFARGTRFSESDAVSTMTQLLEALSYAQEPVDDLPTVLEFDPGSFVLTAFGRSNAGTVRGDATVADRYLNMFFRI